MSTTLYIALVQTPLVWEDPEANRQLLTKKIASISTKADLIVLPEMFTTGFTMHPERVAGHEGQKTLDWMLETAFNHNVAITGSTVFYEKGTYYNRLFFVMPNGTNYQYDKRHTFTLSGEHKVYKAGTAKTIIHFKGFGICPLICYDLRFPVWARNTEGYDVLLYVANWPKPRILAWDALLKARAIENMSYCIGVNRVGRDEEGHEYPGHSAVYGPLGKQITFSEEDTILYAQLSKDSIIDARQKLRFLEDRDTFNLE